MHRILFVCLGNICRSPTAEAVFRKLVEEAGYQDEFEIDSAGTSAYHIGEAPDRRSQAAARRRGYDMSGLRARQVTPADFEYYDLILAMDNNNLRELVSQCPQSLRPKVRLFLEYGQRFHEKEVPDPYYGGKDGFDHVLDLIEDASRGLLASLMGQ